MCRVENHKSLSSTIISLKDQPSLAILLRVAAISGVLIAVFTPETENREKSLPKSSQRTNISKPTKNSSLLQERMWRNSKNASIGWIWLIQKRRVNNHQK